MENPFKALGHLFGKLGHLMAKLLHFVGETFTDGQIQIAMTYINQAATQFVDNDARRHWVSSQIQQRFHFSESLANLLTELALQAVKKELAKGEAALETAIEGS